MEILELLRIPQSFVGLIGETPVAGVHVLSNWLQPGLSTLGGSQGPSPAGGLSLHVKVEGSKSLL